MNLWELAQALETRQVSPVEVLNETLQHIKQKNPGLNAFATVCEEDALHAARVAEAEISAGNYRGPLHGVPIGVKDMIYTKGIRTTMGSKVYADFVPADDATIVARLKQAGAVVTGKLNTHEFAYGPMGDRSMFGPVHNPFDVTKISGGSSSGSGAAVAASLCYGAIGTDTGGSIRVPSACCGIVGMKPTFGRVSKHGVFPLSYTLDHIGPMTRTVRDNALLLNAIVGYDAADAYSVDQPAEDFSRLLERPIRSAVIGVPSEYFSDQLDPEIEQAIVSALQVFASLGAEIRSVSVPNLDFITWAQPIIQKSEAYAVHEATLQLYANQLDPEVRERLEASADTKGYEYVKAIRFRKEARTALDKVFDEIDVMLTPTLPILPPDIDQREVVLNGKTEAVRQMLLKLTSPFNYTGHPSLSVPCGLSSGGLPIGIQLVGRSYSEAQLYRFGAQFEAAVGAWLSPDD